MRDTATYKKVLHAEILFAMATTEGVGPSPRLSLLSEASQLLGGKRYPMPGIRNTSARRNPDWVSPTQIGQELGISATVVGRCLKLAGLHGTQDKGRGWSRLTDSKQYVYDRSVVSAVVATIHKQQEAFETSVRYQARRELRR